MRSKRSIVVKAVKPVLERYSVYELSGVESVQHDFVSILFCPTPFPTFCADVTSVNTKDEASQRNYLDATDLVQSIERFVALFF
mmetsp:Transcript_27397/g.38234  ORF Transcript_27397/g.38234 Transcript_27397/m.38234 type:complete len:84 (-) Transcript_27397:599-850(-)